MPPPAGRPPPGYGEQAGLAQERRPGDILHSLVGHGLATDGREEGREAGAIASGTPEEDTSLDVGAEGPSGEPQPERVNLAEPTYANVDSGPSLT
jgi:hypothetical protein